MRQRITAVLLAALVLFIGQLGESQSSSPVTDSLEATNVAFNPQTGNVSFTLLNKSPKPVLAWGLEIRSTEADGNTDSHHVWTDLLPTIPLVGISRSRPGSHIGELKSGEGADLQFPAHRRTGDSSGSTSVLPEFVVFADDTVTGDESRAAEVFDLRVALRDEYVTYLPAILALVHSSNPEADLTALTNKAKRARAGENTFGRSEPQYAKNRMIYGQFSAELDGVLGCIGSKRQSPSTCLSKYAARVQSSHDAFVAHAQRAGGAK